MGFTRRSCLLNIILMHLCTEGTVKILHYSGTDGDLLWSNLPTPLLRIGLVWGVAQTLNIFLTFKTSKKCSQNNNCLTPKIDSREDQLSKISNFWPYPIFIFLKLVFLSVCPIRLELNFSTNFIVKFNKKCLYAIRT